MIDFSAARENFFCALMKVISFCTGSKLTSKAVRKDRCNARQWEEVSAEKEAIFP
jgi:hypothetical protein